MAKNEMFVSVSVTGDCFVLLNTWDGKRCFFYFTDVLCDTPYFPAS